MVFYRVDIGARLEFFSSFYDAEIEVKHSDFARGLMKKVQYSTDHTITKCRIDTRLKKHKNKDLSDLWEDCEILHDYNYDFDD